MHIMLCPRSPSWPPGSLSVGIVKFQPYNFSKLKNAYEQKEKEPNAMVLWSLSPFFITASMWNYSVAFPIGQRWMLCEFSVREKSGYFFNLVKQKNEWFNEVLRRIRGGLQNGLLAVLAECKNSLSVRLHSFLNPKPFHKWFKHTASLRNN